LLGIHAAELTPVAIIAFGTALVLSSNAVWHLHVLKRAVIATESESLAEAKFWQAKWPRVPRECRRSPGWARSCSGILAIAGTGADDMILILVALLALGATLVLTGSSLSGTVMSFMRPSTQTY
jgi:hypothetical protein